MAAFSEAVDRTKDPRYTPVDDATIAYGPSSINFPEAVGTADPFYITTAIAYTNGYPHMGHAYESLSTDILARYHRILGRDTQFCTGSDEHGQKVDASAKKAGRTPIEHCDIYVKVYTHTISSLAILMVYTHLCSSV